MIIVDQGVSQSSMMDFCIPSQFAKDYLYYVEQYGTFYCDRNYRVSRDFLDSFLLIFVISGTLHLETRGMTVSASDNQIILLDCRMPHTYYCLDECTFSWFHFNGNSSSAYTGYIYDTAGVVIGDGSDRIRFLRDRFDSLISNAQKLPANEHAISAEISSILAGIASHSSTQGITRKDHPIQKAINYISSEYAESISIAELAEMCTLSESHFIRLFRKYENMTPHEFILSYRLKEAKRLLQTSEISIEEIADSCGFNSASHFARAFRKSTGISPTEFRNIIF